MRILISPLSCQINYKWCGLLAYLKFEDLHMLRANVGKRGGKSSMLIYQASSKIQKWTKKPLIIYMVNNKSCCSEGVIITATVLGWVCVWQHLLKCIPHDFKPVSFKYHDIPVWKWVDIFWHKIVKNPSVCCFGFWFIQQNKLSCKTDLERCNAFSTYVRKTL